MEQAPGINEMFETDENPSTSLMKEHIQRVDVWIREDQVIVLTQVAAIVGIYNGSAQAIGNDDFGYHKVCACRVSKQASGADMAL